MAAAAVGLGNLWRFPYMVGENGGAAFILAYLIALIVIVLPIMMLEVSAGRLAQGGAVHTFAQVNRFGKLFGWCVVALTAGITSYYLVITGWTLGYAGGAPVPLPLRLRRNQIASLHTLSIKIEHIPPFTPRSRDSRAWTCPSPPRCTGSSSKGSTPHDAVEELLLRDPKPERP
jgi:hypothetical protein